MTDAEILSVLKSIDKSLKSASAAAKERQSLTRKIAGGGDEADTKSTAEASKVMKATASAAKKLSSATLGLTKTFDGLNVEVKRTISNFGSLGTQLTKLMDSLQVKDVQTPTLNLDTKELGVFRTELNKSIGTFGMLNTRLGKLIQRVGSMAPDRDKLTKAIMDASTKAMFPLQALGKQASQVAGQLTQLSAAMGAAFEQVNKLSSSLIVPQNAFKDVDDFGSKLSELANGASIDTQWAKDLEELVNIKLNPRLEDLATTANTFDLELNKIIRTLQNNGPDGRDELERELKHSIITAKELNKNASTLAANFKVMNTDLAKLSLGIANTSAGLTKFIAVLNSKIQQPQQAPNNGGLFAGFLAGLSTIFSKPQAPAQAPNVNVTTPPVQVPQPNVNVTVQPAPVTVTPGAPIIAAVPAPAQAPAPMQASAPTPPAPGGPQKPITPALNTAPANKGLGALAAGALRGGAMLLIFEKIARQAFEASLKLKDDFLLLASVGMGSSAALLSISKSAIKAGMSVEEYTKVLAQNSELASRAGSLDNFDKLTSAADKQLSQLGVFGADAKALQATMLNSATLAGVPQEQFGDVLKAQVGTFDRLRKSVNMTSQEFGELVSSVTNNVQTQKELVGLAPNQRAARQQELLDLAATGRQLGLSAEASKRLTDALIAQRGETVKKRFEGAGRVRQLAAMVGQSGAGEEAAQIIMKGRRASKEELERLRVIAGELDAGAQSMQETGSFGQQAALDTLDDALQGSAFKGIMDANRPAQLSQQSGEVANKDFGVHVSEFGQFVGQLNTIANGLEKSVLAPLVGAVMALAGGLLAKTIGGGIVSVIKGAMMGGGGLAKSLVSGAQTATGVASSFMKTIASAPVNLIKSAASGMGSLFSKLMAFPTRILSSIGTALTSTSGATSTAGSILARGASMVRGAVNGLGSIITGAGSWIAKGTQVLSNAWTGFRTFFVGMGTQASGSFKMFTSMFGAAFNTVGAVLKGAFRIAAWVGPLVDGISEAFTGAISSTFSEGGGIMDRIFGVALAAFRSVPAALFGAFDWAFGTNFKNGLDIVLTTMLLGIQTIKDKFFSGLYAVVSKIPFLKDSAFGNTLKEWKENQENDAMKTAQTLETLVNDQSASLDTIGKKNTEVAKEREKETVKATTKAAEVDKKFNSTNVGMISRAGILADAKTLAGMPAQQTVSSVAQSPSTNAVSAPQNTQQAQVNTPDKAAEATKQQPTEGTNVDLTVQLTEMITLLRAQLAAANRQIAIGEEQLGVSALSTKTATSFVPSEYVNYHLLRV